MKKAIIIGASSGIGRELAEQLVASDYQVGITGRRIEMLKEIQSLHPTAIVIKKQDCTLMNNELILQELVKDLGGLDLFILSSGTGHLNTSLNFQLEKETIDLNVLAFTQIMDWAYSYFENKGKGQLVAISSLGGLRGSKIAPAYNASKAFQINYLEGLRQKAHSSSSDLCVTDVRPGFVKTAMAKGEGQFWVAPVEKASRQILNAIRYKKEVVYVTKRWRLFAFLLKILPRWVYNRM